MDKKNVKKFRGSRTCGGGTHKNRRGAGNRGGRGNAGGDKHHYVRNMQRGMTFGKHGFKRPQKVKYTDKTINVAELDEMADYLVGIDLAKADDDNDGIHINLSDFNIDKVLGRGKVTKKLIIYGECSETARLKIEDEGGRIVT
ncbi:MAG: uL15 family ribosomal protein [Halobacteriota archaeon]|nr:uL15 family ribosomal protein [Halobacteriota archaeon]